MKKFILISLPLLLITPLFSNAQDQPDLDHSVSMLRDYSAEDYEKLVLPPLNELLENMKTHSPSIRYQEDMANFSKSDIKTARRQIWSSLRIVGAYQYGVTSDLSYMNEGTTPIYSRYSNKANNIWNVGASLSLPFVELFDRGNKIKKAKAQVKAYETLAERTYEEQTLKAIAAYVAVQQAVAGLKVVADALVIAKAQYTVTEKEFINGAVDAQTLSRQKNIESQAAIQYEEVRASLNTNLLQLEALTYTKIINR